jgi:hypothetical protein
LENVWTIFRQYLDPSQSLTDKIPGMESPQAEIVSNELDEVILYPNPAWQTVQVLDPEQQVIDSFEIYDALGRLQLHMSGSSSVDVSQLNEGVYSVRLQTKKGVISRSLFITKK